MHGHYQYADINLIKFKHLIICFKSFILVHSVLHINDNDLQLLMILNISYYTLALTWESYRE